MKKYWASSASGNFGFSLSRCGGYAAHSEKSIWRLWARPMQSVDKREVARRVPNATVAHKLRNFRRDMHMRKLL